MQNLSLYLTELYHKNITLNKTNLGLSNDIYTTYIDNMKCAIRVPKDDLYDIVGINERNTLDLIKNTNLDVNEIYYDTKTRIRITKWVDNYVTYKNLNDKSKLIRATRLIYKLHSFKFKTDYYFNSFEMYQNFKKGIKRPLINYDSYEYLFKEYNSFDDEYILCHNDIVSGNLLFTDDKDYLIDYEYAGMNHPYFDIMSLITENNIDDENDRKIIYNEYFGGSPNDEIRNKLKIVENMQNVLWAAWANMLYDIRKDQRYLEIFESKKEHLYKGLR